MARRRTTEAVSPDPPGNQTMDLSSLRAILDSEKWAAMSATRAGKLSIDRTKALDYFVGDVSSDLEDQDGRSKAVSMDVMETIEGMMAPLMEMFAAGDQVVKFLPRHADDVLAAEQETDYVNKVFMEDNPGFMLLYNFFKDALVSKTGIIKVIHEEVEDYEQKTYFDLTDLEYRVLVMDKTLEVIAHTEKDEPEAPPMGEPEMDQAYN